MGRNHDSAPTPPPRVRAAFAFRHHARMITEQVDSAIPMRSLTLLEKSVEAAALRTVQQYLLGEMDFAQEEAQEPAPKQSGDDDPKEPVVSTQ